MALLAYISLRFVTELINSTELNYSINWDSLIYPIWWWLAFAAARRVATDAARAVALLRGITVPLLITAPIAVGQALGIGPVLDFTARYVTSEGFQARISNAAQLRAVGLVGHWTHWGVYCAALITVGFILLILARRHNVGGGTYPLVVIIVGLMGVASSITFAPAFIVAVVVIVSFRRIGVNLLAVIAMGAGIAGAAAVLGAGLEERIAFQATGVSKIEWLPDWVPSTLSYRLYIWITETIPMVLDRIVTGWGLNVYEGAYPTLFDPHRVYPNQMRWPTAESQWLQESMASGLLGLVGLIAIFVAIFGLLRATRGQLLADIAAPIGAFVFSLLIAATTAPMLTNKGAPLVLWPLLGIVIALQESVGREVPGIRPPSSTMSHSTRAVGDFVPRNGSRKVR
ncbi:MAG: O-antigen ligase family protein [Rhodoglobus sp.]